MRKTISIIILLVFITTSVRSPAYASMGAPSPQQATTFWMPQPGGMVHLSSEFNPSTLVGITIHPDNALQFDFLINKGEQTLDIDQKKEEYKKLVKYFLASLAIPDADQWVNLSPYEKDRIIKDDFGKTEMGRDLLAQDYLLKQITSSLIYPEQGLGKEFWNTVYQRAWNEYHTTSIPVNTFNKVWILPDEAMVYESGNTAYILKSHLKVMLEEDYLSLQKHSAIKDNSHAIGSQVIREIILPALEKEVNTAKNFANLRQMYSGMILATWYKRALKESLLGKVYADRAKVKGVDQDPRTNQVIYQQYLKAFKKGVFNYIKEDVDKYTNETIPRKYFSGGFMRNSAGIKIITSEDLAKIPLRDKAQISKALKSDGEVVEVMFTPTDSAMTGEPEIGKIVSFGADGRYKGVLVKRNSDQVLVISNKYSVLSDFFNTMKKGLIDKGLAKMGVGFVEGEYDDGKRITTMTMKDPKEEYEDFEQRYRIERREQARIKESWKQFGMNLPGNETENIDGYMARVDKQVSAKGSAIGWAMGNDYKYDDSLREFFNVMNKGVGLKGAEYVIGVFKGVRIGIVGGEKYSDFRKRYNQQAWWLKIFSKNVTEDQVVNINGYEAIYVVEEAVGGSSVNGLVVGDYKYYIDLKEFFNVMKKGLDLLLTKYGAGFVQGKFNGTTMEVTNPTETYQDFERRFQGEKDRAMMTEEVDFGGFFKGKILHRKTGNVLVLDKDYDKYFSLGELYEIMVEGLYHQGVRLVEAEFAGVTITMSNLNEKYPDFERRYNKLKKTQEMKIEVHRQFDEDVPLYKIKKLDGYYLARFEKQGKAKGLEMGNKYSYGGSLKKFLDTMIKGLSIKGVKYVVGEFNGTRIGIVEPENYLAFKKRYEEAEKEQKKIRYVFGKNIPPGELVRINDGQYFARRVIQEDLHGLVMGYYLYSGDLEKFFNVMKQALTENLIEFVEGKFNGTTMEVTNPRETYQEFEERFQRIRDEDFVKSIAEIRDHIFVYPREDGKKGRIITLSRPEKELITDDEWEKWMVFLIGQVKAMDSNVEVKEERNELLITTSLSRAEALKVVDMAMTVTEVSLISFLLELIALSNRRGTPGLKPTHEQMPAEHKMMAEIRKAMKIDPQDNGGSKITFTITNEVKQAVKAFWAVVSPGVELQDVNFEKEKVEIEQILSRAYGEKVKVGDDGQSISFETNRSVKIVKEQMFVVDDMAMASIKEILASQKVLAALSRAMIIESGENRSKVTIRITPEIKKAIEDYRTIVNPTVELSEGDLTARIQRILSELYHVPVTVTEDSLSLSFETFLPMEMIKRQMDAAMTNDATLLALQIAAPASFAVLFLLCIFAKDTRRFNKWLKEHSSTSITAGKEDDHTDKPLDWELLYKKDKERYIDVAKINEKIFLSEGGRENEQLINKEIPVGGIDFNSANLNLQIKRDGKGVPLPLAQQDIAQLNTIQGFVPVILEIKPAVNLPILNELQQELQV